MTTVIVGGESPKAIKFDGLDTGTVFEYLYNGSAQQGIKRSGNSWIFLCGGATDTMHDFYKGRNRIVTRVFSTLTLA